MHRSVRSRCLPFLRPAFVVAVALFAAGCVKPVDGPWKGTTSEGMPITFTVANGAVQNFSYQYMFRECERSGWCMNSYGQSVPAVALNGQKFTLSVSPAAAEGGKVTLEGTLIGKDHMTGTVKSDAPVTECKCTVDLTWEARPVT